MKNQSGFNLIELMVVLAIVAIIASIAYPAYTDYVTEARRSDAFTALTSASHELERCYSALGTYNNSGCGLIDNAQAFIGFTSEQGHYAIGAQALTGTTFTLRATPQGGQVKDTDCGYLELTQAGTKSSQHGGDCW
jgi:type IV pilus assembly protein PilE